MRTLTIAGGGLAGLALGIALRGRDVPVCIVEAADYPRHRVCGEFISGVRSEELAALGIEDLFAGAHRHRTTAWFDGATPMLSRTLPDRAWGVSRHYLDAVLAERFRYLGGKLRTGERWSEDKDGPGVVWACGRRKAASPWMGLKGHFNGLELGADLEVHLQNRGYVGLTRVENGRVNVCGLFRRSVPVTAGREANVLVAAMRDAGLAALADRVGEAKLDPASLKGVNQFAMGWQAGNDGRVCIGDAAALIPPFTGNGMSMAFQSALLAVEPLHEWALGRSGWATTAERVAVVRQRSFARRLLWARVLQAVLMRRSGRWCAGFLLRSGCVSFESLYRKVR